MITLIDWQIRMSLDSVKEKNYVVLSCVKKNFFFFSKAMYAGLQ